MLSMFSFFSLESVLLLTTAASQTQRSALTPVFFGLALTNGVVS